MNSIDATMQYDDDGLPWGHRLDAMFALAVCHGVDVRIERKSPERELGYYSITVSADDMHSMKRFIAGLFTHIGVADSPIFYVRAKNRYRLPGFYKRLAKTPIQNTIGIEC